MRKIDDTHYALDRALVDEILADPSVIQGAARFVPSIQDGKANGFRVYTIGADSLLAELGIQNGDTISSINGYQVASADQQLATYDKVKSASRLSVQTSRRGVSVTLEYTIK